jgi:glycerate kinase
MRVVIAPDKFKGSLTAIEAAEAMARGVARVDPRAAIDRVPMADGGEGTVHALVAATGGTYHQARVTGPQGEPLWATFGLLGRTETAVLEMASASGLTLVPHELRDPRRTTTFGTGELLLAAVAAGARRVIVGIGGSATNDGGAGLGQALGYRLLDDQGEEIGPGGGELGKLVRIDPTGRDAELDSVEIAVACDVSNRLCGAQGASAIYGPQKGATPDMIKELDQNLAHFARIVERDLGMSILHIPGGGAAGGLGAGLVAFAGGRLQTGVDLIIEAVNLEKRLKGAGLCLTGEGAIDGQSSYGKTAVGVARLAHKSGCPVIALAGSLGPGVEAVLDEGIDAYFSLCPGPISLEDAVARASGLLADCASQAFRAFLAGSKSHQPS